MKNIKYILFILLAILSSSCLKMGLEDLPAFEEAEIESVKFEYRWLSMNVENERLTVIELPTTYAVDSATSTVSCDITVPAVSADFPQEEYDKVALSNIVAYTSISTAATIRPLGDSPVLGTIADYSSNDFEYEVTAADGSTKRIWTLSIASFTK